MSRPKVSVIIPAYNPGLYLALAVQSVIQQTFSDWELVVVDDGSEEDVEAGLPRDSRIRVVRQENAGTSVARNIGISHSSGGFVAFLDQDDLWRPEKLQQQLEVMATDPDIGLCHTQFDIVDSKGDVKGPGFGRQQMYLGLLRGSGICGATTVLIRRSALSVGLFDTFHQPSEDYDLWLRIAFRFKTGFVPEVQASYRHHEQNQSLEYAHVYKAISCILQKHIVAAEARKDIAAVEAARTGIRNYKNNSAARAFEQGRAGLRSQQFKQAAPHLRFAALHSPKFVMNEIVQKALSFK